MISQKGLLKKAQSTVNRWVRERETLCGVGVCVSCGATKSIDELDAGHFIPTTCSLLRFDVKQIHVQCRMCNRYLHGNLIGYTLWMINTYGKKYVEELQKIKSSHQTKKWTEEELKQIIKKYE